MSDCRRPSLPYFRKSPPTMIAPQSLPVTQEQLAQVPAEAGGEFFEIFNLNRFRFHRNQILIP